jgi:hypothetical protein
MTEPGKERAVDRPWSFPVRLEDVPETGLQIALSADESTRAALAKLADVRGLSRVDANFDVFRVGDGLHVTGEVKALVEQTCVVTLEPLQNEIIELIDLDFRPDAASRRSDDDDQEPPEQLIEGTADLGTIATEFLLLGIDPYPRKPGAVFEPPQAPTAEPGPFAALSRLQTKGKRGDKVQ